MQIKFDYANIMHAQINLMQKEAAETGVLRNSFRILCKLTPSDKLLN